MATAILAVPGLSTGSEPRRPLSSGQMVATISRPAFQATPSDCLAHFIMERRLLLTIPGRVAGGEAREPPFSIAPAARTTHDDPCLR